MVERIWKLATPIGVRLDVVLVFLVIMLVGSVIAMFVVPPFLFKIERTGRVDFYGFKFL
jgi:hypothetical protein